MDFKLLENYIKALPSFSIPVADCIVYKNHEPIFRCMTDEADRNMQYWLYSSSKVATCVAIMQLIERGQISLEDELCKWIPSFKRMMVRLEDGSLIPADRKITIFHLLTMTAGLSYDIDTPEILALQEKGDGTTRDFVDAIAKMPLSFHPGTDFLYSLCHDVLGAVIEVVSGQKLSSYMKEHIFEPLGMKHTGFHVTEENKKHIAKFYRFNPETLRAEVLDTRCEYQLSEQYESGGAGILSTVEDYILLADALACGGVGRTGARILMEESIRLMNQNHLNEVGLHTFQSGVGHQGYGYGLGVRTLMNPEEVPTACKSREFGWAGAAGSYTLVDPEQHVSIFYAMQVKGHMGYTYLTHPHNMIRDLVYKELL